MRRKSPVNVVFHYPASQDARQQLAKSVAEIHAKSVHTNIKSLGCPMAQKLELLDSVIATEKKRAK